jgi:uncharacterized repeat protein (TIGR01451 family)
MKQFYLCSILILAVFSANAQIIDIPDANFKAALIVQGVDTNGNSEIEQSEAEATQYLSVCCSNIASLQGIEHFHNLLSLECSNNFLTTLDVSNLQYLTYLRCSHNLLTSLIVSELTELTALDCDNNLLTSLDITNLPVQQLNCYHNQLTQLLHNSDMGTFNIAYNQLTSVVIPSMIYWPGTGFLNISGNLYTSVSIPSTSGQINSFVCNDTKLVSLDLSGVTFSMGGDDFEITNNQDLEYINIKNGSHDFCKDDPSQTQWCMGTSLGIHDNPSLSLICTDDLELYDYDLDHLVSESEFYQDAATSVSTYCSFTPGGDYNTVTGNIKLDLNGNGCDVADEAVANLSLALTSGIEIHGNTFTNASGNYTSYIPWGNQTITPHFENPYFSVSPTSFTSAFSGTGNTQTVDFCIAPNGVHPDLKVSMFSLFPARPGFDATYKIVYQNQGTETQSGSVTLNFEDAILDFISATPNIDSQSANTLSWNFTSLAPFESREITFTLNVNSPMEIPAVNNGDILTFNTQINVVQTDETPADNTFTFSQTVIGSFDPNDKAVSKSVMALTALDEYLFYTVRFQNTGTAAAENVVVKDMLSSKLNLSTLQIVSSSHSYRATLTSGNKLEFFFEGINLPAESQNEPLSHGYITFKIKPKNNLVLNDIIENIAEIYFDFNFPVVTNTVSTSVSALGTGDFTRSNFSLYPNPAHQTVAIHCENNISFKDVKIYNMLDQLVKTIQRNNSDNEIIIDISDLLSGNYFVILESPDLRITKKLIKW